MTTPRSAWTRAGGWRFARHYLEMLVAMLLGMAVLGPLESALLDPLGWRSVRAVPELDALVMATNMTAAMVAWMGYRRHGWAATGLMAAAMYLPFVVLFAPLWLGALSPTGVLVGGHLLMLPAMAGAMLLRREEYTGHHPRQATRSRPHRARSIPSHAGEGLRPVTPRRREAFTSLPPGPNRSTGPMLMSSGRPRSRTGDRSSTDPVSQWATARAARHRRGGAMPAAHSHRPRTAPQHSQPAAPPCQPSASCCSAATPVSTRPT